MGTYEFNGDKYEKASRHQKQWGNKLISQMHLKGNESILDLGCGNGALTAELAELVPEGKVLGVDASKGMLETAKKYTLDNLQFMCMDINHMDFDNAFDVIFSNAALHWIKDHNRLLSHAFSALRPGGMILWNFAGHGTCSSFIEVVKNKMKEEKYRDGFRNFTWPWYMPKRTEYEQLAETIGFSALSVTEENEDRYFADADEMIRWIDQPCLVPFIKCVPEEWKEEYRDEVIGEMLRRTLQPDGTCFETFRRLRVYAVK